MEKQAAVRTAIAAGVAGLGLSFGAMAMATAADDTTEPNATAGAPAAGAPADGDRGPGRHGGERAAELATALGIDEDKVADALEAVRDELRPDAPADGERPAPPTEEERAARETAFANALAEELDLSVDQVTAAIEKVRAAHQAERRTALSERLDAAVEDGDLTAGDKASVLKAYDAGVLGRGPGGLGGPGGHGGPGGR